MAHEEDTTYQELQEAGGHETIKVFTTPLRLFFYYDYYHTNGQVFSHIGKTLGECRTQRDNWIRGQEDLDTNKTYPKVIHVAQNSTGYEIVELLADRVSEKNGFAPIRFEGKIYFTGGLLFKDSVYLREFLDRYPKELQYQIAKTIYHRPHAPHQFWGGM